MSKSPEFPPYQGRVVWLTSKEQWAITVAHNGGGMISPTDVFQTFVLESHLRQAGVESIRASNDTKNYRCVVWRSQTGDLAKHGQKLIKVLEKHYAQLKGRPVEWILN